MILDQKVNVLKGAKNRHFPKGIIHGFCPKIEFLFIWFFLSVIKSEKNFFFQYSWQNRMILDQKIHVLKGAKK